MAVRVVGVDAAMRALDLSDQAMRVSPRRRFVQALVRNRSALIGVVLIGVLALIALSAPLIAPYDPTEQDLLNALAPPSQAHPLGTDEFGRDLLSRIIFGSRISLLVGFLVVGLAGTTGTLLGLIAGFYGGWVDSLVSRFIDVLLAFPGFLLALAVLAVLGASLVNALLAIAVAVIPSYTRVIRGAVLTQKSRDYVTAAQVMGATGTRVIARHLFPNVVAPLIVLATLGIAGAILTAASLSFLGLGAEPPTPEWGAMLATGRRFIFRGAWWVATFPGLAIMIAVLALNLLGDGLRDIFDPKLRGR